MTAKLSAPQRLNIIERTLKGENISSLCKEYGISRTLLYRWLKRYRVVKSQNKSIALEPKSQTVKTRNKIASDKISQIIKIVKKHPRWSVEKIYNNLPNDNDGKRIVGRHGVQNVLKRLNLNTIVNREKFVINQTKYISKYLSVSDRLSMINRARSGEAVNTICKEFGVSRTTFYNWLKRYNKATDSQKIEALWNKKRLVERYHKQAPEHYEKAVLSAVVKNPIYSSHKLVWALPQVNGKPILGNHGVQNVLRRHNLNTHEQRNAFAHENANAYLQPTFSIPSASQAVRDWKAPIFGGLPSYSGFAPPALWRGWPSFIQKIISSKYFISIAFVISISFILSLVLSNLSFGQGIVGKIGILFSFLALFFGMFFFIYSIKYYLTIAIVLSFSRHTGEDKKKQEKKTSLHLDISNVTLERHPFVSIHIATFNEKRVIERLLKAIISMQYDNYEVVIADDSNDETTLIIENYLKSQSSNVKSTSQNSNLSTFTSVEIRPGLTIKHIHRSTREGFKGGALKGALEQTDPKAEYILIFDADFIPYADTITQFLKYFQATAGTLDFSSENIASLLNCSIAKENDQVENNNETMKQCNNRIAAIQGYQWHVLNKSENWITRGVRTEYSGSYVIERSGEEIYSGLKQISGSVYMIKRNVLESIGWGTSITEDFELTLKLYEKGYKVVYTPYIQAPAEAASTIKRIIRQRMRWAEGHSHNIRKMFGRLMFGKWESSPVISTSLSSQSHGPSGVEGSNSSQSLLREIPPRSASWRIGRNDKKQWVSSPLTFPEKLEFLYLSPYYLQAAFFIFGTLSWFIAEVIFKVRLPFWTEVWGWSLVFTNLLALPLLNMVGLFMEESDEKDYLGLFSFIVLSYIVAPFQGYAAVKGFLAKEEGPWFRTPKTGRITDNFVPGRLYRFVRGIFGGRVAPSLIHSDSALISAVRISTDFSAHQRFNNFKIKRKTVRWVGNMAFTFLILLTISVMIFSPLIPLTQQTQAQAKGTFATIENAKRVQGTSSVKDAIKDNGEITTPRSIRLDTSTGEPLEFIFHKEPRVRIKIGHKEIDVETLEIPGLGSSHPKKSIMYGSERVVYEEIVPNVDLEYVIEGGNLKEHFILKKKVSIRYVAQRLNLTDLEILTNGKSYGFYDLEGNGVYTLKNPEIYEQDRPALHNLDVTFSLKKEMSGYTLQKILEPEAISWLSDPNRVFPVILDPDVIVSTGVGDNGVFTGGNQRKVYYHASFKKYYAIINSVSGDDTFLYYCDEDQTGSDDCSTVGGSGWSAGRDISTTSDDHAPNLWFDGTVLWAVWGNNGADDIVFRSITPVDGQTDDTLGTAECDTGDLLGSNGAWEDANPIGLILAGDGTTGYVWGDQDPDILTFTWPAASCSTDPTFSAANTSTGGLTAAGNLVGVPNDGSSGAVTFFWQDSAASTGLQANELSGTTWTGEFTIENVEGDNFSVTKDSSHNIWIIHATSGGGSADLYKCASQCDASGDVAIQSDPWTSATNLIHATVTYVSDNNDLLLAVTANASEQAYWKNWDIDTTSLTDGVTAAGNGTSVGFTAGDLSDISSPYSVAVRSTAGVVLRQGTNFEFSTIPERSLVLLLVMPFVPRILKRLRAKMKRGKK